MPYIKQKDRDYLKANREARTSGELNYVITLLLIEGNDNLRNIVLSLADFYVFQKGLSYQTINDIMGAMTNAGLEYVRRTIDRNRNLEALEELAQTANEFYETIAAPYEDEKIKLNGDVYD